MSERQVSNSLWDGLPEELRAILWASSPSGSGMTRKPRRPAQPEWLIEPPAAGDFRITVSIPPETAVSARLRQLVADLVDELERDPAVRTFDPLADCGFNSCGTNKGGCVVHGVTPPCPMYRPGCPAFM
jgi:hypothetical protein